MPLIQYRDPDVGYPGKWWPGDVSLGLSALPFPVREEIAIDIFGDNTEEPWEILDFGQRVVEGERDPKYGHDDTWVHVLYRKRCGHLVVERIPFMEDVRTFDHYGTIFQGEHYSIHDWEDRIKWFQNQMLCEVCEMSFHRWWIVTEKLWSYTAGGNPIMDLQNMLDATYLNWQDFLFLGEDFPGGKVRKAWRPGRPPKPNTFKRTDEIIGRSQNPWANEDQFLIP